MAVKNNWCATMQRDCGHVFRCKDCLTSPTCNLRKGSHKNCFKCVRKVKGIPCPDATYTRI